MAEWSKNINQLSAFLIVNPGKSTFIESLFSANTKKCCDSILKLGAWLAPVGFPAPKGFDADAEFLGQLFACFLQFHAAFYDPLAE